MTDLRKAAEMALEALEYHQEQTRPIHKTQETIAALRQALAQPEQEPFKPDWVNYRQGLKDGAAQPEQEPVAWMEMVVANLVREGVNKHKARELAHHFYTYSTPNK